MLEITVVSGRRAIHNNVMWNVVAVYWQPPARRPVSRPENSGPFYTALLLCPAGRPGRNSLLSPHAITQCFLHPHPAPLPYFTPKQNMWVQCCVNGLVCHQLTFSSHHHPVWFCRASFESDKHDFDTCTFSICSLLMVAGWRRCRLQSHSTITPHNQRRCTGKLLIIRPAYQLKDC